MQASAANDELILEGIIVTVDALGNPNIAPMGPRVDRQVSRLTLRPFKTAQTFGNVQATGVAVFHVTDDCLLVAQAAIGRLSIAPPLIEVAGFRCPRLADTCRWFALEVIALDDADERAAIQCRIVASGEERPFFGFNRAKHAVVEAAILATRIGILNDDEIRNEMQRLDAMIVKTAGLQERAAFELLQEFIAAKTRSVAMKIKNSETEN